MNSNLNTKTSIFYRCFILFILIFQLTQKVSANDKYLGEFVLQQDKIWVELLSNGNEVDEYVELYRDEWSVALVDSSFTKKVRIDLYTNKIYQAAISGSEVETYNVMSPADGSVRGYTASRVTYGSLDDSAATPTYRDGTQTLGYVWYAATLPSDYEDFNAGIGFYSSVWPLLNRPLKSLQIGLPGIWVRPDNSDVEEDLCPEGTLASTWSERSGNHFKDVFQTMEGGSGYWINNRFQTNQPKFSINGTSQCYDYEISTPGWPFFYSSTPLDDDKMGLAQLSNRVLIPPDAMTFEGNPNGEFIGYTWMSLPLDEPSYLGEFIQKEGAEWVVLDKNGDEVSQFEEVARDAWSVYLNDDSRGVSVQLDLWTEEIYQYPSNQLQDKALLYNVAKPLDRSVGGDVVDRVIFTSTENDASQISTPTGDNSWTLFINTENFKGPLAYYIPDSWSRIAEEFDYEFDIGKGLDAKMAVPDSTSGAMEFNTVPHFEGTDSDGNQYRKIPALYFPTDDNDRSVIVRDVKLYSKSALYDDLSSWESGADLVDGSFADAGVTLDLITASMDYKFADASINGINETATPTIFDGGVSWGLEWNNSEVSPAGKFPQYFKYENGEYQAISMEEVPEETGLFDKTFIAKTKGDSYSAPELGAWVSPGPIDNTTYTVQLNDGSTVDYRWYRFIDQPAFQQFNFSDEKKVHLQAFIEKMHREWGIDKDYMAAPTDGALVSIDDNLIVTPPAGMEYGYVPIVVYHGYEQ